VCTSALAAVGFRVVTGGGTVALLLARKIRLVQRREIL